MYHLTLGLMIGLAALQPEGERTGGRFEIAALYGWGAGYGLNTFSGRGTRDGYGYGYNNYGYARPYYRPYYNAPGYTPYNTPYNNGYNNAPYQQPPYQAPYYNAPGPAEPYQPPYQTYQPAPQDMPEGEAPAPPSEEGTPVPRARNPAPTNGLRPTEAPPGPRARAGATPEGESAAPETEQPTARPAGPPPIPLRMPDAQTVAERRESLKQFDAQRRALQLRRQAEAAEDAKIHIPAPGEKAAPDTSNERVTIKVVFTGHSLATATGEKLYLAGVRTPFFAVFEGVKPQPGGKEAHAFTQQRTEGVEVRVVDDTPLSASSGKRSVYLFLPDGTLLNAELLKLGLAKVDNAHPFARQVEFQRLESQARAQRSGLWK